MDYCYETNFQDLESFMDFSAAPEPEPMFRSAQPPAFSGDVMDLLYSPSLAPSKPTRSESYVSVGESSMGSAETKPAAHNAMMDLDWLLDDPAYVSPPVAVAQDDGMFQMESTAPHAAVPEEDFSWLLDDYPLEYKNEPSAPVVTQVTQPKVAPVKAAAPKAKKRSAKRKLKKDNVHTLRLQLAEAFEKYLNVKDDVLVEESARKHAFRNYKYLHFRLNKKPRLRFGKKVTVRDLSKYSKTRVRVNGRFVKSTK